MRSSSSKNLSNWARLCETKPVRVLSSNHLPRVSQRHKMSSLKPTKPITEARRVMLRRSSPPRKRKRRRTRRKRRRTKTSPSTQESK